MYCPRMQIERYTETDDTESYGEESTLVTFHYLNNRQPDDDSVPTFVVMRSVQTLVRTERSLDEKAREVGLNFADTAERYFWSNGQPNFEAKVDHYILPVGTRPEEVRSYDELVEPWIWIDGHGAVYVNHQGQGLGSFDGLRDAKRAGLIEADPRHVFVGYSVGRGGDAAFVDVINWLLEHGVDVGTQLATTSIPALVAWKFAGWRRNSRADKQARKIAALWARQGVDAPHILRKIVWAKYAWTSADLAKRLHLTEVTAEQLLKAVGYSENRLGEWTPGHSRAAKKLLKRWQKDEFRDRFNENGVDIPN